MEEIEKDDVATEAALPPSPPGSTEEAFAGTESKNSKGMTNEKQEKSAEKKTAQYGSIPDGPNTGEQNKTKAVADGNTYRLPPAFTPVLGCSPFLIESDALVVPLPTLDTEQHQAQPTSLMKVDLEEGSGGYVKKIEEDVNVNLKEIRNDCF